MAFMMPVVKNDYNLYRPNSSSSHGRKTSECAKSKDASLSTNKAGSNSTVASPAHRATSVATSSRQSAGNSSKVSHLSLQSSSKSYSPLPRKSNSMSSLSLFHNKFVDKLRRPLKSKDSSNNGSNSSLPSTGGARRKS